ncbi:IS4 family transposase ISDha5 [Paenibacillus marchantiophytorum]|uniref:IS4 family transposase ISDha5 n=2 Tax=Paenibacillus marchantiophytorum TaxID=1619310 RepID=A0ABQ1EKH6_9BACL|nr:transposase [Paenibacillus marchantiophytorum]GFZ75981.1 IS4 family transposase ISDha5 [Paenibacillus marchantiophytorum]
MSIVSNPSASEQQLTSQVDQFFVQHRISKLLKQSNFFKECGFTCFELFKFIFLLVFGNKNLYQTLKKEDDTARPGKDSLYRFLNSSRFNWRKFLLRLSCGLIQTKLSPLSSGECVKVLILDDSLFSRARSKAVELLANVHDHTTGKFVRGFRMLTLGWSDGNTFVPLCFSLLSSHKQENRYVEMSTDNDKRTVGYKRREESMMKSSVALLELLEQALAAGVQASYLLFDSWFSFPSTIMNVLKQGIHVICMLKAMPKVFYTYNGAKFNLNGLYKEVRKKRGKAKILASVVVILGVDESDQEVNARIVFVRDRNRSKQWLALLSTDINLTDEEIVRIYGKRWDIEVFFKMNKSYLRLAKEFQGRSYDMMFAHTTLVFTRYLFLAMETRENKDQRTLGHLFYVCCDELEDIKLATTLMLLVDLLKQAIQEVLLLTEEQFQEIFDRFTASLPKFYKGLLGISG